jgi:hypothetical protein
LELERFTGDNAAINKETHFKWHQNMAVQVHMFRFMCVKIPNSCAASYEHDLNYAIVYQW